MKADSFPFFATVNALFEILHAFLDVTIEHIVLVDFCSASFNDLVRDFGQQTLHSLWSVVVFTELPDDSDTIQGFWKNLGDVFWLSLLDLSAWVRESIEELKVVLSLIISLLDLKLEIEEARKI